jgi:hypothetical protein
MSSARRERGFVRRSPLVIGVLVVLFSPRMVDADVPPTERLDADCIDRTNAHLPEGPPVLVRPYAGVAAASSRFGPLMSPGLGTRLGIDGDVVVDPSAESLGPTLLYEASAIYAPSAQAYSAWAAIGINRRSHVIHSVADTPGHCDVYRYDARLFVGPWVSALSGASRSLDMRVGPIAGLAYRQVRALWGWEVMLAPAVTFNPGRPFDRPDETRTLFTGLLRLGGWIWHFSGLLELRYTTDEYGASFVIGIPLEK